MTESRIRNQRLELKVLNERCRDMSNQLGVIDRVDYIKSRLHGLDNNNSYRSIIMDRKFKIEVMEIFNRPLHECIIYYDELITRRNLIAHKFTRQNWGLDRKKRNMTNMTLEQLASTL